MFVPVVRSASSKYDNVVHKTIIYNDTVLNLKADGKSLKVTAISKIDESSFEKCLEVIFNANPDVIFNTIQYSHKNKKVYFYTDAEVNTKAWEESKVKKFSPYHTPATIKDIIEVILNSEDNLDCEYTSAYDVWRMIKLTDAEIDDKKSSIEQKMRTRLKQHDKNWYCCLHNFQYDENAVSVAIHTYSDYEHFLFKKNDEGIYVAEAKDNTWLNPSDALMLIGAEVEEFFDYSVGKRYLRDWHTIKTMISQLEMTICGTSSVEITCLYNSFEIEKRVSGKFSYSCNTNSVLSLLRDRENEFMQKVFVKIDDCPEWMRESLAERRKHYIKEETKRRRIEKKKQRICESWKKIFPFLT